MKYFLDGNEINIKDLRQEWFNVGKKAKEVHLDYYTRIVLSKIDKHGNIYFKKSGFEVSY